jgi:hypothetical protein
MSKCSDHMQRVLLVLPPQAISWWKLYSFTQQAFIISSFNLYHEASENMLRIHKLIFEFINWL